MKHAKKPVYGHFNKFYSYVLTTGKLYVVFGFIIISAICLYNINNKKKHVARGQLNDLSINFLVYCNLKLDGKG